MIGVLHRSSGRGEMKIITKLQYESIQDACVSDASFVEDHNSINVPMSWSDSGVATSKLEH
jgi:hypothetical protein